MRYQSLSSEEITYASALLHAEVGTRHALISERTRVRTGQVFTITEVDSLNRRLLTRPPAEFGYCVDGKFRLILANGSADPKSFLDMPTVLHPLTPLKFVVHPPEHLRPLKGGPVMVSELTAPFPEKPEEPAAELPEDPAFVVQQRAMAAARFVLQNERNHGEGHRLGSE